MDTGFSEAMARTFVWIATELQPALEAKFAGQIKVGKITHKKTTIKLGTKRYQLRYEPKKNNLYLRLYKYESDIYGKRKFVFDRFIRANTLEVVNYLLK